MAFPRVSYRKLTAELKPIQIGNLINNFWQILHLADFFNVHAEQSNGLFIKA